MLPCTSNYHVRVTDQSDCIAPVLVQRNFLRTAAVAGKKNGGVLDSVWRKYRRERFVQMATAVEGRKCMLA